MRLGMVVSKFLQCRSIPIDEAINRIQERGAET